MNKNSAIFIYPNSGLIANALKKNLKAKGYTGVIASSENKVDFTNQKSVVNFFKNIGIDYCFIGHIKEGGIETNISCPAQLLYQNLIVQTNIIHAAYKSVVKKLIYIGSSCAYPKDSKEPIKEQSLLSGPPEITNEAFAVAKISGIKMCQYYRKQYKTNFLSVIPATVYGVQDNFDLKTSHVIPALIRKFHQAKRYAKPHVEIWGSGRPRREFIWSEDVANALIFLMGKFTDIDLINIGCGEDISIRQLACLIKKITGFKGNLKFDKNKPDGTYRKLLDSRLIRSLGWSPNTSLEKGIGILYNWYLNFSTLKKSKT